MIEDGEGADQTHDRVGHAVVVGGNIGQVLDLSHHVVAEEACEATEQRGQILDLGRGVRGEELLESDEHSLIGGKVDAGVAGDRHPAVAQHEGCHWITADEGEPAPALTVLDRLEDETGIIADELHESRDRGLQIGQHLGPHRHHRVFGGEIEEGFRVGMELHGASGRKKQVRSPVWQAPRPCCTTPNSNVSPSQS